MLRRFPVGLSAPAPPKLPRDVCGQPRPGCALWQAVCWPQWWGCGRCAACVGVGSGVRPYLIVRSYLIHRLRCRWSSVCVRVAAAALRFLPPPFSTRALFLVPEQRPPLPLPRRPKSRVAPVVSLCYYALQSCCACRYTVALCASALPVHRQVHHLPFPWSAPFHLVVSFNFRPLSVWPLRVGWRQRLLLLRSFSACACSAAPFRSLSVPASYRCPRPCRIRLRLRRFLPRR